jgi:hypothetical protein
MDAWEILYDNSTLASGDAWEHLNNQEGGGGGDITISGYISASIDQPTLSSNITTILSANINTETLTAEVGGVLSANIDTTLEAET